MYLLLSYFGWGVILIDINKKFSVREASDQLTISTKRIQYMWVETPNFILLESFWKDILFLHLKEISNSKYCLTHDHEELIWLLAKGNPSFGSEEWQYHQGLPRTVLVYTSCPSIINSVPIHSHRCSSLNDQLHGHLSYTLIPKHWGID